MSNEETTAVAVLKEQMKTVQDQVQKVDERVGKLDAKIDNKFDELHRTLKEGFDKADSKYASIWVEQGVKWAVGIIISAVLLALLSLVVIKGGGV